MANLKNITDVPVVESAQGLNLIVNDNGAAKQIAASAVGAQADWAETDASNPAFIKNKPVEEWDLDVDANFIFAEDGPIVEANINTGTFDAIKNKVLNGEHNKIKVHFIAPDPEDTSIIANEICTTISVAHFPYGTFHPESECIVFMVFSFIGGGITMCALFPNNTIEVMIP